MENSFVKDKGRLSLFNWGKSCGMVRIAVLTALMAVMILGMTAVAFGADMENQGDGQEDGVQVLETVYVEGDGLQDGGFQVYYPPGLGGETGGRYSLNNSSINEGTKTDYQILEERSIAAWEAWAHSEKLYDIPSQWKELYSIINDLNEKGNDATQEEWDAMWAKFHEIASRSIKVSDLKIFNDSQTLDQSDLDNYYFPIIQDHPEYFYVTTGGGLYKINNEIYLAPIYIYGDAMGNTTNDVLLKEIAEFNTKIDSILSCVLNSDNELDDLQKVLLFHEYIILNCTYGDYKNNDKKTYYTAYGALVNEEAVCQGYALAYGLLLDRVGIDNIYISSPYIFETDGDGNPVLDEDNNPIIIGGMGHAWNAVKLKGSSGGDHWYHVDLTWDDPTNELDKGTYEGYSRKNYFLKSDNTFKNPSAESGSKAHKDWTAAFQCKDTTYEDEKYVFNKSISPIYYMDGAFYYFMGPYAQLMKSTTLDQVDMEKDGILDTYSSTSYLQCDGNNLYFFSYNPYNTAEKGIRRYNTATESGGLILLRNNLPDSQTDLYGLALNNGQLSWVPNDSISKENLDVSSYAHVYTFGSPIYYDANGLAQVGDINQVGDLFVSIKNNDNDGAAQNIWIADYDESNKMINIQKLPINIKIYEEQVVNLSKLGDAPGDSAAVRKYFILNDSSQVNKYEPWSKTLVL